MPSGLPHPSLARLPLLLLVFAIACADAVLNPTAPPSRAAMDIDRDAVPPRGDDAAYPHWSRASDTALWNHTASLDTLFAIGLKRPGANRGIYRGHFLVTPAERETARRALLARDDVRLVWTDTLLPVVYAKLRSLETLSAIRRLPFVDYIEPLLMSSKDLYQDSGCGWEAWTGVHDYTASGDVLPRTYKMMRIDRAWAYVPSAGAGEWIGLTDTGVDTFLGEFGAAFSSGESTGRLIEQFGEADPFPTCSHGTRMAGVLAAPRNGTSVVGIAWRANLFSARHSDHLYYLSFESLGGYNQGLAIRRSVERGSRVIVMAWGGPLSSDLIFDEIQFDHYVRDVLFAGAAGSSPADLDQNFVMFPARMAEVLAVSGADWGGARDAQSHYGPELDIIAYQNQPTTGDSFHQGLYSIEASSNATGVVAGIATLVRSRFPALTNEQVKQRLISTAGPKCRMAPAFHLLVNAEAAVGGTCWILGGPDKVDVGYWTTTGSATFAANVTGGIGPIRHRWSNGATTPTSTYTFSLGPNRTTKYYEVWVTVTDEGSGLPGETERRTVKVSALPYDGTCPPGEVCHK